MSEPMHLRIMTANIWGDYFQNPVSLRENAFTAAFERYKPDIIGLQEMTQSWYDSRMFNAMQAQYAVVGMVCGSHENYVPLAYNKQRFTLLECGFKRYSNTPDRSKAITYAALEDGNCGQCFCVCNTHFWWKTGPEHDKIRLRNADELIACMRMLRQDYAAPVFAFGDLNCRIDSGVFERFTENGVVRLYDWAKERCMLTSHHGDPVLGTEGLYHGSIAQASQEASIDHIIGMCDTRRCIVHAYQLALDQSLIDASDHSPVYADITMLP